MAARRSSAWPSPWGWCWRWGGGASGAQSHVRAAEPGLRLRPAWQSKGTFVLAAGGTGGHLFPGPGAGGGTDAPRLCHPSDDGRARARLWQVLPRRRNAHRAVGHAVARRSRGCCRAGCCGSMAATARRARSCKRVKPLRRHRLRRLSVLPADPGGGAAEDSLLRA